MILFFCAHAAGESQSPNFFMRIFQSQFVGTKNMDHHFSAATQNSGSSVLGAAVILYCFTQKLWKQPKTLGANKNITILDSGRENISVFGSDA